MKQTNNLVVCLFCLLASTHSYSQLLISPKDDQEKILPHGTNQVSGRLDLALSFENNSPGSVQNIFIITLDGFRWQDLFNGMDKNLLSNDKFTPSANLMRALYSGDSPEERRKKLMPFFWNVIGSQGQNYGNRFYKNYVNVANDYLKSYPGYSEMFTGITDPDISSNRKIENPNTNVFEFLNKCPGFENKVAAFTSWDVFPYILNRERSGLHINSGFEPLNYPDQTAEEVLINKTEEEGIDQESKTRYDELTFLVAKNYIRKNTPRVLYLSFGETDEFAHQERYDLYLEKANQIDNMLAELWRFVQTTPGYANNTTFLITTDHGRGSKKFWTSHGQLITGSSETWLAVIGPGLSPLGEVKKSQQMYQQQIAQTIAHLLGKDYIGDQDTN